MKIEFNYRDYDNYKEWLDRIINTLYEDNNYLKNELIKEKEKNIKLKEYIEQLENIRKEAIEWIDEHDYYSGSSDIYYFSDFTPSNDLLNILNKGDNNE